MAPKTKVTEKKVNPIELAKQLDDQKRKVDFDTFDITVREIVNMVDDGLINIAPEYQRLFRWTASGESTFLESVFLGIPIPSLFLAANPDGTWELIDGVQRLSTLVHFTRNDRNLELIGRKERLVLKDLKKLESFNDLTFDDLPQTIQTKFLLKPIKVTTISDNSNLDVRFDLFERLNTGGIRLTAQEIRSCIYRGPFRDFIKKLSQHPSFIKVVNLTETEEKDGTREEFVLRFFAFLDNYQQFDHSVKDFLNQYMASNAQAFEKRSKEIIFKKVFDELHIAIPGGIRRGTFKTTPVNLFEGIAVGAALAMKEKKFKPNNLVEWMESPDLKRYTSGATNTRKMVQGRITYCRDKFME